MTATRPTCRRRVLPVRLEEATVLSRAVCPCEMLPAGMPGLVSINGKTYTLAYNATLPEVGRAGRPRLPAHLDGRVQGLRRPRRPGDVRLPRLDLPPRNAGLPPAASIASRSASGKRPASWPDTHTRPAARAAGPSPSNQGEPNMATATLDSPDRPRDPPPTPRGTTPSWPRSARARLPRLGRSHRRPDRRVRGLRRPGRGDGRPAAAASPTPSPATTCVRTPGTPPGPCGRTSACWSPTPPTPSPRWPAARS